MANSFDIASFNLINWANSVVDLYDSTPKDVEIIQKDNNGNLFTKDIANRGKFKQELWDDVGSALGQFNRTFYVDADNGDDNNNGDSGHPFKTMGKALDSIPIGGYGSINIVGVYDFGDNQYGTGKNKVINISIGNNAQLKNTPSDDGNHVLYGGIVINSNTVVELFIENNDGDDNELTKIHQPNIDSDNSVRPDRQGMFGFDSWSSGNAYLAIITRVYDDDTKILNVEKSTLIYRKNWSSNKGGTFGFSISGHNTGSIVIDSGNNAKLAILDGVATTFNWSPSGYGIKNADGDDITIQSVISGIVKDSNNVPLSIVSNVNFE